MAVTSAQIDTMVANQMAAFFDPNYVSPAMVTMPRIRHANSAPAYWGLPNDTAGTGAWWMMEDVLRLMVERCRAFPGDNAMIARVKQQAAYLVSQYPEYELEGSGFGQNGSSDGTINSSDDAAWKMQSYCDLHRITGTADWLTRAQAALPKCLSRFADPYHAQVDAGDGVKWSPYGILYAGPDDSMAPQHISSSIETGMVQAALYIYEQTGVQGYLNYAKGMAQRWIKLGNAADPGFQDPSNAGAYFVEVDLSASPPAPYIRNFNVTPPNYPFRNGGSPRMIQASMGVGIVCAKLYRITKDASWLAPIRQVIGALSSTSIYLVCGGKFLNDRDPYSGGFFACDFVREVLSLRTEGVDPGDMVRTAFVNTAAYILANPSGNTFDASDPNIYYSADWGVANDDNRSGKNIDGYASWTADGNANRGHPATGTTAEVMQQQAVPQQMMTSSLSGVMAIAGYLCGTLTGATLTDNGTPLSDNGQTLVDA